MKLDLSFDTELLLESYNNLTSKINFDHNNQIGLSHRPGVENVWTDACGSLVIKDEKGNIISKDGKSQYTKQEKDFTIFNNLLFDSYFYQIKNELQKNLRVNFTRIRLINLPPKRCLSWHLDNEDRIHIPIKTKKGSFFLEQRDDGINCIEMLEIGCVYKVMTSKNYHTAINSSSKDRVHLVFNMG